MRIYLDCCCFNRPFDQEGEDRVAIEAEAVLRIFARVEAREWELVVSDAVLYELRRIPDSRRRGSCLAMTRQAALHVRFDSAITTETLRLAALGFKWLDAAHLAFAKAGRADVFLTVDDRLLRKARSVSDSELPVIVNPAGWLVALREGETS